MDRKNQVEFPGEIGENVSSCCDEFMGLSAVKQEKTHQKESNEVMDLTLSEMRKQKCVNDEYLCLPQY